MVNSQVAIASTSKTNKNNGGNNAGNSEANAKKIKKPRHRNRKQKNKDVVDNSVINHSGSDLSGLRRSARIAKQQQENSPTKTNDEVLSERQKKRKQRALEFATRRMATLDINSSASEINNIELCIEPVPRPVAKIFRTRNKKASYINLNTFKTSSSASILVFESASYNINKIQNVQQYSKDSIKEAKKDGKAKRQRRKENKVKEEDSEPSLPFPDYLSDEEIKNGLVNGELIKGNIRINPKNFKEAYVGNEDISKCDYIITSVLDRNRALEGDEIVLRVKSSEINRKLGQVVAITQKVHPRIAVGFLHPVKNNREWAEFLPRDKRIPIIRVPKICWPNGFQENPQIFAKILLQAKLLEWSNTKHAIGLLTEILGLVGDLKVESIAILKEFCLNPLPYTGDLTGILPKTNEISNVELLSRDDLRKDCIFTIDPATAKDLDDAVSCKLLENGNYKVGVHISDASYYLKENTELDQFVREKATTIYMVETAYHMLPVELCLFCSLLPKEDKLAFSVFWELTPDAEIVTQRITRTVINSCAQLSYEHAQKMIDFPCEELNNSEFPLICNGFTLQDLHECVNHLHKISLKLREKRIENGALRIDQPKLAFALDPTTGQPSNFWIYENKPAHRLIEEYMLLANITVAKAIYEAYPDIAFLRLHEPPKQIMLDQLKKNLESVGIHIDITSSGGINTSLSKYSGDDILAQSRQAVLNHLFAKPMVRARYFCSGCVEEENFEHYALSIPIYTHFTSPIRRYADIMVHRLLAASLNYREPPNYTVEEVSEIADICNRQKYQAKRAGDASIELYLAHYIEDHQPFIQKAVIVDVRERSCDLIVLLTGTVVRLYSNRFGNSVDWKAVPIETSVDDKTDADERKMWRIYVTYPQTKTQPPHSVILEIFTVVTVALERKPKTNKLEATLLRPLQ